jgi:hypothetical protein
MNLLIKISSFIALIIGIFFAGKSKGKNDNKQDIIENELRDIKDTEKRREERANISIADKRKFLQNRIKNKS